MATVVVKGLARKGMSVHGNPSYWVEFEPKFKLSAISVRKGYTASDSQCSYSACNFVGKDCRIEFHFTKKGNLIIDTMKEAW